MKSTSQETLALGTKNSLECTVELGKSKTKPIDANCTETHETTVDEQTAPPEWELSSTKKSSLQYSKGTATISSSDEQKVIVPKTMLPEWQHENAKYIESGHRAVTPSLMQCIQSWFYLHNESVNIHSHLLPALLFLTLPLGLSMLGRIYSIWPVWDFIAISIFLYGVGTCFLLSALFHTLSSHSEKGYHTARQADFQGIIVLVLATSSPQVYYTFYHEPALMKMYWSVIGATGIAASLASFMPFFKSASGSPVRVAIFAAMGLATFAPIVHGVLRHGLDHQSERFPVWAVALTHFFNMVGAIAYTTHFPERYFPKRFDLFGASHQLMHCSIVAAALTLLTGTLLAFDRANGPSKGVVI